MKIAVLIPTRNRTRRLVAAITMFEEQAKGNHDVTYHLIADADDENSCKIAALMMRDIEPKIVWHVDTDRRVQHRVNQALKSIDAEAYIIWADDLFCVTRHWDEIVHLAMTEHGLKAFAWTEQSDPANHTATTLSRQYVDAMANPHPGYFAFWFGDTWIAEVFELAHGEAMPIVQDLQVGGQRGTTAGMRDLAFWFDFFAATRTERIDQAIELAHALGIKLEDRGQILADMERRDLWQKGRVPMYEEVFGAGGDKREPSETYLRLKADADAWLVRNAERRAA